MLLFCVFMSEMSSDGTRFTSTAVSSTNLSWITNEIAVSGCFASDGLTQLAERHGISAVVDLREEACDDERALRDAGIAFLHLPTPDLHPSQSSMLDRGVLFVGNQIERGGRVLIHCVHGIGRSPLLALCVMVDQGMRPLDALRQAKDRREEVSPSEDQYRGWAEWLERHGHSVPSYHEFGCIAYRHLAQS